MREHRNDVSSIAPLIGAFRDTAETVQEVFFGGDAFRRVNRTGGAGRTVNKALFDTVMLSLYFADRQAVVAKREEITAAFPDLLADPDFDAMIGRATADRVRVFGRIMAFSAMLERLGIPTRYLEAVPQE